MSRHFILATHGTFAEGIASSIEIILGTQSNLHTLCAYVSGNDDITQTVATFLQRFAETDELIIITDIFGGSINNEFIKYLTKPNIHLIAGLNLPLIIQLLTHSKEPDITAIIDTAIKTSVDAIQYCNQTIKNCSIPDKEF